MSVVLVVVVVICVLGCILYVVGMMGNGDGPM
jgi:Flp pilus assembly protein protease CpaA